MAWHSLLDTKEWDRKYKDKEYADKEKARIKKANINYEKSKKMGVNKAITVLLMSLIISLGHSQEKTRFFELKKTNEYKYKISKNKKEITLFSNTEDSQNSFSISFNVEKTILAKCCTIKSENYNWLLKNERLKYKKEGENIIDLNNFKGLIIYKRESSKCHAYKVKSRIFIAE